MAREEAAKNMTEHEAELKQAKIIEE